MTDTTGDRPRGVGGVRGKQHEPQTRSPLVACVTVGRISWSPRYKTGRKASRYVAEPLKNLKKMEIQKTNWEHRCGFECGCTDATLRKLLGEKPLNMPCYDWYETNACISDGHFPVFCPLEKPVEASD